MDSGKINNLAELRAEILRLRLRRAEQEAYLADRFVALRDKVTRPVRFVNAIPGRMP